ncbi:MAG: Rieske (2Fe-2S) protein [Gammaproteobacteria bacterium]|jgi:nitrite reductase/ring-hydroxylating ferredoxin subunit|nr:Rieske (2Fe-2S) protein [Gammaproteobacteria bacterium]
MSTIRKKLISYDELHNLDSKGLTVIVEEMQLTIFVVKKDKQIFVYENSCPHTQGPLDWVPDNFLDGNQKFIMCANHGALFQINDGLCVYGPCKSQSLRALPFEIENGEVYLLV